MNNLSLIFYDNPIARGYLNAFLDKNKIDIKIFYLSHFSSFEFVKKAIFRKNNYFALNFLQDKRLSQLIVDIERFFSLRENFLKDMFNYNNINYFNNISYITSQSINSRKAISLLKASKEKNFLISYQELLDKAFDCNKNFYHIHPGYLPKVKGADGSLHSIINYNELGCSFFMLEKKIDSGPTIKRKVFEFKKFKLANFKNFNERELYNFWFSFVDPALRCSMLIDFLECDFSLNNTIKFKKNDISNYYTFIKKNELTSVFKKIFFE